MSNFISVFKSGKEGKNIGLDTGIAALNVLIGGIQKSSTIGIAASPKVGKTTLADYIALLSPYLMMEKVGKLDKVEWIYFSGEIDRVTKEFKIAAFFMAYDYGRYFFQYKGISYPMCQDYLMGRFLVRDKNDSTEVVPISDEDEKLLKQVYYNRIIPIFGEYSAEGVQIKPGKVIFVEDLENPTGLNKYLLHYAEQHGKFLHEKYFVTEDKKRVEKTRIVSYKENDPEKFTVIITDHVRKLKRERGFTLKENIDKWLEYTTILRNMCRFSFIHICHSNRNVSNVDRLKFAGESIFPTGDDVKDSGNLSEECTALITMFNPHDEKYNLDKHMGVELDSNPNYRSIHLVEARFAADCPAHIQVNMFGGVNMFSPLNNNL